MDATHALRCNFVHAAAHNFDNTGSEIQPLIHPRYVRSAMAVAYSGKDDRSEP